MGYEASTAGSRGLDSRIPRPRQPDPDASPGRQPGTAPDASPGRQPGTAPDASPGRQLGSRGLDSRIRGLSRPQNRHGSGLVVGMVGDGSILRIATSIPVVWPPWALSTGATRFLGQFDAAKRQGATRAFSDS